MKKLTIIQSLSGLLLVFMSYVGFAHSAKQCGNAISLSENQLQIKTENALTNRNSSRDYSVSFTSPVSTDVYTVGTDDKIEVRIQHTGLGVFWGYLYLINQGFNQYVTFFEATEDGTLEFDYDIQDELLSSDSYRFEFFFYQRNP